MVEQTSLAKQKVQVEMLSYGRYSDWDSSSKELPQIQQFTQEIPVAVGTEFGYILEICKGKGQTLDFIIEHPPFKDKSGKTAPPFKGSLIIPTNAYSFFLGDCIWEPVDDKTGTWTLTTKIEGEVVARKSFDMVPAEVSAPAGQENSS